MIKRHFFLAAAAGLLVLMLIAALIRVGFAGDDEKAGPGAGGRGAGRGQQVAATVAEARPFSDKIDVLGAARGRRSVNVTSSTTELITAVLFRDGQRVSAGQPLVQLQAREEDAGIIEARAMLAQAQRQYDRYKTLSDRGIAPRATTEQYQAELETARAGLAAAQARRGDRMIRAPFAGIMGLSTVTAGTLINPGSVIATLDDIDMVRVDFPVPERYLGVLRAGLPLTATTDAYGGESFSGRIALVDTRVNEQTRSVTARAEFANPGGRIRPGMMMRVSVSQGQRTSPAVPEAAVQYEGEGAFVYRIAPRTGGAASVGARAAGQGRGGQGRGGQGQAQGGGGPSGGLTAQRVEVETGAVEGGFVEITSGLNVGDRVVASGLNRIQPNSPVQIAGQGGGRATQGASTTRGATAQGAAR